MKLFGKSENKKVCCCGVSYIPEALQKAETAKESSGIKILGSGCAKCMELEKATRIAVSELGLQMEIEHVTEKVSLSESIPEDLCR